MKTEVILKDSLAMVIDMANQQIEDIESGVEEGIYDPEENQDIDARREAVALVQSKIDQFVASDKGMYTLIHGQSVPVSVAYGLMHQVVREYDDQEIDGVKYLGGTTSLNPETKQRYPWFSDVRDAIQYLMQAGFAGYVQTYVAEADGSGPSWITAGVHFRKTSGNRMLIS